ncbi:MAG: ParB/RepB/Spo0J family partition protein [Dactylosporangium sp.]|nr:ParB/RepB/Spo0J family partition protein [Dactylosporangium sp.]NNJ61067.1 ParB/RepB/Spo0J family partition protein [Dactylosporangium sp.]
MKSNRRGGLGRGLGALIPTGPAVPPQGTPMVPTAVPAPPAPPPAPPAGTVTGDPESGQAAAVDAPAAALEAPEAPAVAEPAESPDGRDDRLAPVPGAHFAEIPVRAILANGKQPRQVFDEDALAELKASIEEVGFLQPIVVRELDGEHFELVMGERRWRAAQSLGRESIPAIVRETRDDAMLLDALLENIHRVNLNPLEEAAAYQQLLEEFGATHEELAKRIGRSRPQISNTIRLLNLPAQVQRRVAAGVLSAGHARALLSLDSVERQEDLAYRIVAEGLSVRATEELVTLTLAEGNDSRKPAPTQRRAKPTAPGLTELADRLSNRFDTSVKVDLGRRKGKITIEFASIDDLDRIVDIIGMHGGDNDGDPVD